MSLYRPETAELGKNAIARRVTALRAMNEAGGAQYTQYDRSGDRPAYLVETPQGAVRPLNTREVPAYVLGAADAYPGIRGHVQEALDAALANPDVSDRDSLMDAVLQGLDDRCGTQLAKAASYFVSEDQPAALAV